MPARIGVGHNAPVEEELQGLAGLEHRRQQIIAHNLHLVTQETFQWLASAGRLSRRSKDLD